MTHPNAALHTGSAIAVIGDCQNTPSVARAGLLALAAEVDLAAVLGVGDLGYGTEEDWTELAAALDGICAFTWGGVLPPFLSVFGNHDAENGGAARWVSNLTSQSAAHPAAELSVRRWTATVAGCRLIGLDTTAAPATAQAAMVRNQTLVAQHFGLEPILVAHYAPYSCNSWDSSSYDTVLLPAIDQFETLGGKLAIYGHEHRYQCTVPMIDGLPSAGGVTHITMGDSGASFETTPQPTKAGAIGADTYDCSDILLAQQSAADNGPMIGRLDVSSSTLRWRVYRIVDSALSLYHDLTLDR